MLDYEKILLELVNEDEKWMVLTAENRALLRNLPPHLKDRFLDTGITEQAMVGIAAGLASRGRVPIVHALAAFLSMRAFEFIRTDVGIPNHNVKLMGFVPGILSDGNGPTHQAIEDVALMRGIPGMHVWAPADTKDFYIGLKSVLQSESPTYVRINLRESLVDHSEKFELGKAEVMQAGSDITFLVYGSLFNETYLTAQKLQESGYSVGLVNMRMVEPIDRAAVITAAQESKMLVTVEDHFVRGGLYTAVAEVLMQEQLTAKVLPIAFDQKWYKPARLNEVLEAEKLTPEHLFGRVKNAFEQKVLR